MTKMKTVICGPCGEVFKGKTEEEANAKYLKHKCKKTGFTPTDVEHYDALSNGRFSLQSKAALARGEKRKNSKNKEK